LFLFFFSITKKNEILKYAKTEFYHKDSLLFRTHMLAWGIPLGIVILALMAQSVRADPLSGICLVGGGNRIIEAVFVSLRELILLLCSLVPLFFGCLALIGSAPVTDHSVASTGLLGSLYPMAAAFLLLSSLQYLLTPTATGWNTVTAIKLLADPLLGILASAGCLIQILFNIFKANRLQLLDKHGYQPAAPQIPQPAIPSHTATASNAYSLSRSGLSPTSSVIPRTFEFFFPFVLLFGKSPSPPATTLCTSAISTKSLHLMRILCLSNLYKLASSRWHPISKTRIAALNEYLSTFT
uniref:Frizzled domain-containing protein n=1 Tax=Wuchereria bancrofti TaxID=6293 RepID=A0A1I8EMV3_WUCBA